MTIKKVGFTPDFILHFPPGSTVDLLLKVVDLEKLSYQCASLVKIGANHVELILGLDIMGRKPTFFMVTGRKEPICWSQVVLTEQMCAMCVVQ